MSTTNEFDTNPNGYIKIQIQNGPIKENGINGCQVDDVIIWCKEKLHNFNKVIASPYNDEAICHLNKALKALQARTADREDRGVEGTYKA